MALYYLLALILSLAVNAALAYWKHNSYSTATATPQLATAGSVVVEGLDTSPDSDPAEKGYESDSDLSTATVDDWTVVSRQYLTVYAFAVAADWLQGSFIYALYEHEYDLPQPVVAALFATGFAAGALSATGAGYLADRFGRKKACLAYCVLYSASCALTMINSHATLFTGRALGGVSATLLYSVFESWMVAEASSQDNNQRMIQDTLASSAAINAVVAIASGFASEVLVTLVGSKRAPFAGSIACLACAASVISVHWNENYGGSRSPLPGQLPRSHWSLKSLLPGPRVAILTLVTSAMEGSMYAMVFFWTPSLERVRPALYGETPYGIIFANFMSAMMLGSWLFWFSTRTDSSMPWVTLLVRLCLPISALCLLLTVLSLAEHIRFLAFCLFELALGLYFPCIALLKSRIIGDSDRSWTYGLMRVPLNVFVLLVLCTTGEGDGYRQNRFVACGGLLICSTVLLSVMRTRG